MRKFILMTFVFGAVLFLFPFVSTATMSFVTDEELDEITGQEGISIAFFDVCISIEIANIAYGDTDSGTMSIGGASVAYSPGFVNVSNLKIENLQISQAAPETTPLGQSNFADINIETFTRSASFATVLGKTAYTIQAGEL